MSFNAKLYENDSCGKRKNPQDKTKSKFYVNAVNAGRKTLRDVARDIAGRSSLMRGDIENVLSNFVDHLPAYLMDGFSIQLGEFGMMRLSLSSKGSDIEKAFNTEGLKPRIVFMPGVELKHQLKETSYEVTKAPKSRKMGVVLVVSGEGRILRNHFRGIAAEQRKAGGICK